MHNHFGHLRITSFRLFVTSRRPDTNCRSWFFTTTTLCKIVIYDSLDMVHMLICVFLAVHSAEACKFFAFSEDSGGRRSSSMPPYLLVRVLCKPTHSKNIKSLHICVTFVEAAWMGLSFVFCVSFSQGGLNVSDCRGEEARNFGAMTSAYLLLEQDM